MPVTFPKGSTFKADIQSVGRAKYTTINASSARYAAGIGSLTSNPDGADTGLLRADPGFTVPISPSRSEEHTSELQSPCNLVCRLLLEKKKKKNNTI